MMRDPFAHLRLLPTSPGEEDAARLCRRIHDEALHGLLHSEATELEVRQYLQAVSLCVRLDGAQNWAAAALSEQAPTAGASLSRRLAQAFGRALASQAQPDLPAALAGQVIGCLALVVAQMDTDQALADAWRLVDRAWPSRDPTGTS